MSPHPTHRYTGTGLVRLRSEKPDLEPGDLCTPTDAELRSFGDCFEELADREVTESIESEAAPNAGGVGSGAGAVIDESTDSADATPPEPDGKGDVPSSEETDSDGTVSDVDRARAILRENGIDPDEYRELQSAATEYDDVAGNLSAGELQLRLAAKLA